MRFRAALLAGYALLAALSVGGLLYSLANQYRLLRSGDVRGWIDDRYAALRAALPSDTRLGYLSDLPLSDNNGDTLFYQTQYAVAPHILLYDAAPRYVIANLTQPALLSELCHDHRLVPVAVADPGLVLLRHEGLR
ncbi:MAG TPA: hypothetical protein VL403_04645 [Candidatus Kryptonia bacterium]|nr:hypothetical protein [Candidatus Kryptonia bacterium]